MLKKIKLKLLERKLNRYWAKRDKYYHLTTKYEKLAKETNKEYCSLFYKELN